MEGQCKGCSRVGEGSCEGSFFSEALACVRMSVFRVWKLDTCTQILRVLQYVYYWYMDTYRVEK